MTAKSIIQDAKDLYLTYRQILELCQTTLACLERAENPKCSPNPEFFLAIAKKELSKAIKLLEQQLE